MNEDITQEIYYCLIEGGYVSEDAQRLCNDPYLKNLLAEYKQKALKKAQEKFIDFIEMVIDCQNYVRYKK